MGARLALARFAAASAPVPAAWARAWVRHHPSLSPHRSEIDCPAEFDRLFALRYHDRFGQGLVPPADGPGVRLRYRPAGPGLSELLVCRADLPDALLDAAGTQAVATLRDEVAAALDPYRKWLARFPHGRDSLAAVPLLPAELIDSRRGRLSAVRIWAERRLDNRPRAVVEAREFWDFWSTATPERMAADEAAAFLGVLARLDLGVEPDVRFGAPPLAPGPAVLFRLGRPATAGPSARFPAAAAIARCAAAVASAAGSLDPFGSAATAVLAATVDLAAALRLGPGEDLRLAARLCWLLTTRVDVDRLGRQTAVLTAAEREFAGRLLITVAGAADPGVGPATVGVLTRVYRILGLPPELVFPRLHELSTGGAPLRAGLVPDQVDHEDEPVVVQAGDTRARGYALPWATPGEIRLDPAAVSRKVAESGTAAALLRDVFEEEREVFKEGHAEEQEAPTVQLVPGLDPAHDALLRALAERPDWSRAEFVSLSARHGILPDGALDLLNEVALDIVGAPLIEGDATLTVANDVLLELLT
jgi:hypothetical protein